MFSKTDVEQLTKHGITPEIALKQIETFSKGFPYLEISAPATVGNGIIRLECDEVDDFVDIYKEYDGSRIKFVPASGAATRMFKHLYEFHQEFPNTGESCLNAERFDSAGYFFQQISKFPFYHKLYNELWKSGFKMDELLEKKNLLPIIDTLLMVDGLNYGNLPKGLILFHQYGDISRSSFEEHMVEGAQYCSDPHGRVHIHLTVSPEHKKGFEDQLEKVKIYYESHYDVKFHINFSIQKPATDTIAVDEYNSPFRNSDNSLLFRPGGHGALIENLNDLDSDLIFIKNIDNVVPDRLKPQTVRYKKALAGLLISYRNIIFDYIYKIKQSSYLNEELLNEILDFIKNELCVLPPSNLNTKSKDELQDYVLSVLDRPIRVCGMVKNQGEPGGGPFWARNPDGSTSLQIVESSQIDLKNPETKKIFNESTHFNPVDLVCYVKDINANKYNLLQFTDPYTGFISVKSKDGRVLKALELPGLWNGAMSNWNTFFVEVPLVTFNPVKSVNDLLREEHQPV